MDPQEAQNPISQSPTHSESSTDGLIESWTFLDEPNKPAMPLRPKGDQTNAQVRPAASEAGANEDSWDNVSDTGSEPENDDRDVMACSSVEELSDTEEQEVTGDNRIYGHKTPSSDEACTLRSRNVEHKQLISNLQQLADVHQCSSVEHKALLSFSQPSQRQTKSERKHTVFSPVSVGGVIILFFMLALFLVRTMKVHLRDNELKTLHDEIDRWSTMAIRTAAQVDRLQNLVNLHDVQYNEIESKKFMEKFAFGKSDQKHATEENPVEKRSAPNQVVYHRRPEPSWNPMESISDYFRETSDLDKNIRRSQHENQRRLHEAKVATHPEKIKHHDDRSKNYKYNRH